MERRFELTEGYSISRVISGGWQLSDGHALKGPLDMDDAKKAFLSLVDEGFDTFDCADIYTGVENFIGEVTEERKKITGRDDIRVHTKFVPDMDALASVDYAYVERIVTRSLKRLRKERLDLVQFHWWDYGVPGYVETASHLVTLKNKGLIANIATTNYDTDHLEELLDAGIPVASNQIQYSVLDRRPERKMADLCLKRGVKLICYGSLAGGFLAEKWLGSPKPAGPKELDNRSLVKYSLVIEDSLGWDGYQKLLAMMKEIGESKGCSLSNVASGYVLRKAAVAAVIIGTRSSRHVESNKKIFSCDLTDDEVRRIDNFLDGYPVLAGEPFELERELGGKHRGIMKVNLADV
ncbi:MAG: aldo/keto reductase [Synergistaceae bacterium]|nr:aldo/keto reductase [Synergistaceae bacterium]